MTTRHTPRPFRARRTVLAVPGSSERFIAKSRGLDVDCIFLDLEDAVAPAAKVEARDQIVRALNGGTWKAPTVTVRVNAWDTPWTTGDVVGVVGAAGAKIDALVLPKVTSAEQVVALDLVLGQVEASAGLEVGKIGFELQIEEALGLQHVDEIAQASERIETLVFGPGDYMAAMGMKGLSVGSQLDGYQADAFHYALMRILIAARANGLQALDGPYVSIRDLAGFKASAAKAAALGYDGKWVVHPSQAEAGNEIFTPDAQQIERAKRIVAAYAAAGEKAEGATGAIVVDDEMVDEAGFKVAKAMLAKLGTSRD
ncbi:CoA ester lyase [Propionimicrobium sp. PCR01-08-3]|uniref:HpcH/HpaI aldolase/citrate lyase family protein n=1 Tax=Propionimicrobium sp. PCR01-08-3 TaxID=3052086 RepID=UPI00255C425C|nr:CoA ester lyase [Propionimicrobium sp. PCR01-08-3]WIY81791.1 CoA ester lyase [Propionimicrobium sp. PCR01-08-3]